MKLSIGLKMSLGLLAMLLLMIVLGAAGFTAVSTMRELTSTLADKHDESAALSKIRIAVAETRANLEEAADLGTEGQITIAHFWYSELKSRVQSYENLPTRTNTELAQKLETSYEEFNTVYEEYRGKLVAREPIDREKLDERIDDAAEGYAATLDDLGAEVDGSVTAALEQAARTQTRTLALMIGFTIAAAILGAGLAWWLVRSVTKPVRRLVEVADNISMGDLDTSIEVTSRDEIGELQESIERMRVSLKAAIERLKKQR